MVHLAHYNIITIRNYLARWAIMPNLDDFYAFNSTSGGDGETGCGLGCLSPASIIIAIIIFVLYVIGKM